MGKYINTFEVKSYLGRLFKRKGPPSSSNEHLLNIGCGKNCFHGWINADFFTFTGRFYKHKQAFDKWECDFRYPLKCENEHFDGVFSEHVLEHLSYEEAVGLLREIYRVLKSGSYLRISLPDLRKYIDHYMGQNVKGFFRRKSGAEGISTLTQGWGHRSVWDEEILRRKFVETGYVDVRLCAFQKGSDPRLLMDSAEREWESLYMEARKPTLGSPAKNVMSNCG